MEQRHKNTYNELNQLTKEEGSLGGKTYSYNKDGNQLSVKGTNEERKYTYNWQGEFIKATIKKGSETTTETYSYDVDGMRTTKTI